MQGRGYRLTKYFGCLNLHAGDEIAQIERDYRTRVDDVTEATTVLEAQSPGHFEGLLEKTVATLTDSRRLQAQLVMQRAIENCQRN